MTPKVRNKAESRARIEQMGLNRVPEIFVEREDAERIRSFFQSNPAELYVVRDAEHSSGRYYYVRTAEECMTKTVNFTGKIIVAVSINTYRNKILLGAIEIDGEAVTICATTDPSLDHRTMYGKLDYDLKTDIFDKKLSRIPEFDFLFRYLCEHGLLGSVVEFTIYDRPVGVNRERILINEIRNY